jgi:5'-nucleotidase
MSLSQWRQIATFTGIVLGLAALFALYRSPSTTPPTAPVVVTILAINDFHGNLRPPPGGISIADPQDKTKKIAVSAGGAEHMATLVKQVRANKKNSVFVAAGDLIGASPLLSALFHDEPTIESLSAMGLEITAVGNHEFDEGKIELLRMQNGGCHPKDGCQGPHKFAGAKFRYLAASTVDKSTGKTLLPAYEVKEFEGIPVAFIGLTLKGTPNVVSPSGVVGLEFRDEAETINALVPQIRQRGIEAIVVLIHEGGFPTGDYNECPGISGPIVDIVGKLDKAVDLVVSGHTHRAYRCVIDGRLVTSADKFGTVVTEIELQLDRKTRDVVSAKADNLIVRTGAYAKDPEQTALLAAYEALVKPPGGRPVGSITAALSRDEGPAGESVLGQIITDAQLSATRAEQDGGAVIGGGDTAMEEATFLTRFASKVTLIHRREEFRASKIMLERAQKNPKIEFLMDTIVEDVLDVSQKEVTALKLRHVKTGLVWDFPTSAMFLGIGHDPNAKMFKDQLDMDPDGYLVTHKFVHTRVPGVFASGDVMDRRYRQAITAAGTGCMAALEVEKFLEAEGGH